MVSVYRPNIIWIDMLDIFATGISKTCTTKETAQRKEKTNEKTQHSYRCAQHRSQNEHQKP